MSAVNPSVEAWRDVLVLARLILVGATSHEKKLIISHGFPHLLKSTNTEHRFQLGTSYLCLILTTTIHHLDPCFELLFHPQRSFFSVNLPEPLENERLS